MQGPFYIILEAASSDGTSNARRLEAFLQTVHGDSSGGGGGVLGGSGHEAQRAEAAAHIWKVRKNLSEGLRLTGGEHELLSLLHVCLIYSQHKTLEAD